MLLFIICFCVFRFVSRWIGAPSTSATSAPVNAWVRYRVSFFRLVFSSFFLFTFFLRQVKSQDASLLGAVILPPSLLASDDNYFLGKPTKKKQQQHQSQHQSRSICFLFSTGDRLLTSWDFYRVLPSFSLIVVGCSGFYLVLLVFFLNFELVCLFCSPRSSGTSCCCCRRFYWPVLRRGTPWRRTGSSLRRLFFLESNRMASSCGRKITRKQTTATAPQRKKKLEELLFFRFCLVWFVRGFQQVGIGPDFFTGVATLHSLRLRLLLRPRLRASFLAATSLSRSSANMKTAGFIASIDRVHSRHERDRFLIVAAIIFPVLELCVSHAPP